MMTAATATSSNIATTTMSATLCSEERTTNNSSSACAAEEGDGDRDRVSSQRRAYDNKKGNFASQTVRLLREERGVQVQAEEEEEEGVANDKRKEGERSELARLRVSLIEAKVD